MTMKRGLVTLKEKEYAALAAVVQITQAKSLFNTSLRGSWYHALLGLLHTTRSTRGFD